MKRDIVFVIDSLQMGGAEKSLCELLPHIRNFSITVVVLFKEKPELRGRLVKSGVSLIELNRTKNAFSYISLQAELRKITSSLNPSIVHSTLSRSDLVTRMIRIFNPGHRFFLINSVVGNPYNQARLKSLNLIIQIKIFFWKVLMLITSPIVDLFIANSNSIAKKSEALVLQSKNKIRVIPRGRLIPDSHFKEGFRRTESGPTKFLTIGRLIPSKGYLELIEAIQIANKELGSFTLSIIGEGGLFETLQSKIYELNLQDSIFLKGNRDDIYSEMVSADFFVFPSTSEGLPGVLIEAMLAQLPIIASDIPENRECVNEEMALFHKVGDPHDLANVLVQAVNTPDWSDRTQKAYQRAVDVFDVTKIAEQYESLYQELILKNSGN